MFIGTNVYGWTQLAAERGEDWDRPRAMADAARAGFDGWEDTFLAPGDVAPVVRDAEAAGLAMRSAYVPCALHDGRAEGAIANACAIAEELLPHGMTRVIVNPDPLPGKGAKDDAQIARQGAALERLGRALRERGAALLFHSHAPEMLEGAREFHHMLAGTDPDAVRLCLDLHWVYRGCGNSQVAVEDVIRLYGDRIDEVHLRQSQGGVWSETLGPGDLDMPRLGRMIVERANAPLTVVEIAYEPGMRRAGDPVAAHGEAVSYAREAFGGARIA